MLAPHPGAALEYWFFKVNAGPIALLVDWIERRRTQEHVVRVSIHSPYKRQVLFEKLSSCMPRDNFLDPSKSVGHAGEIAWELDIDDGKDWIKPDIFPAGSLKMTDLLLVSAPLAHFSGWICHGAQKFTLNNAAGLVSHYWGRQLATEWWWVSAQQFDREGVAVECAVFRSRLWGAPVQVPLAYFYLHQPDRREFRVPLQPARVRGSPENFEIEINQFGKDKLTLVGAGREYGDFGEGIINTLTGDLEIREGNRVIALAAGTAGLERRAGSGRPAPARD